MSGDVDAAITETDDEVATIEADRAAITATVSRLALRPAAYARLRRSSNQFGPGRESHADLNREISIFFLDALHELALTAAGVASEHREILDRHEVERHLVETFDIPHHGGHVSFHRIGTTSVVLRVHGGQHGERAIKLVLPVFHGHPDIVEATEQYSARYGSLGRNTRSPTVARVYRSTKFLIEMDFVDGDTLEEFLQRPSVVLDDSTYERQRLGIHVAVELLLALADLATNLRDQRTSVDESLHHHDVSPSNVILPRDEVTRRRTGELNALVEPNVVLIDMGRNYLSLDGVGSFAATARSAQHSAPEMNDVNWSSDDDDRADEYSVGLILMDVLVGRVLTIEERRQRLLQAHHRFPLLARTIEELLIVDGRRRNATIAAGAGDKVEERLTTTAQHLDHVATFDLDSEPTRQRGPRPRATWRKALSLVLFSIVAIPLWILDAVQTLRQMRRRQREANTHNPAGFPTLGAHFAKLQNRFLAAHVACVASIAVCAALIVGEWVPILSEFPDPAADSVMRSERIAGRLVGISYAAMGLTYYVKLFSETTLLGLWSHRWSRIWWADVMVAVQTCGYAPFVMVGCWWKPELWPFYAACGAGITALTNNRVHAACGDLLRTRMDDGSRPLDHVGVARAELDDFFRTKVSKEDRRSDPTNREPGLDGWSTQMLLYACTLTGLGFLLVFDVAEDQLVFAGGIVVINVLRIQLHVLKDDHTNRVKGFVNRAVAIGAWAQACRIGP